MEGRGAAMSRSELTGVIHLDSCGIRMKPNSILLNPKHRGHGGWFVRAEGLVKHVVVTIFFAIILI